MEIDAVRAQLKLLEVEFEQFISDDEKVVDATTTAATTAKDTNGLVPGSMATRVVELLNAHREKIFKAPVIARELGIKNVNSLRGTLRRLADSKRIDQPGRGKFRAAKESVTMSP